MSHKQTATWMWLSVVGFGGMALMFASSHEWQGVLTFAPFAVWAVVEGIRNIKASREPEPTD